VPQQLSRRTDAIGQGAQDTLDNLANTNLDDLRGDLAKLTKTVSELVQSQAASTRDQVVNAMGAASDSFAQSAAVAQDRFVSAEAHGPSGENSLCNRRRDGWRSR
jgi:hypothetical protein